MTPSDCDTRRKFHLEKVREQIEAIEDGARPWPEQPDAGAAAGAEAARATQQRAAAVSSVDSRRFSLAIRFLFAAFFTVLLGWLETAALAGYPMPGPLSAGDHPRVFLAVDAGLLLAVGALCGPGLLRGFRSLVTFRAETGSLLAVAFVGALADAGYLLAVPAGFAGGRRLVYSAAAAAVLTLYLLGRLVRLRRVRHTACALAEGGAFYTLRRVAVGKKGSARPGSLAACPVRTGAPDEVLGGQRAPTPADRIARVLAPVVLLGAAGVGGLNLWQRGSLAEAAASFAVVCCAGAPAVYELCQAVALLQTSRQLHRRRAALTGYAAVREFENADLLVVDADMLFPPENARIHGIKTFSGARIEEAVVDAASVVIAAKGPLAEAFRGLIRDTDAVLLQPERVVYREDQGICAMLGGKRIVAGSRDILRSFGIQAPPREYEAKYVSMGRDLFYLAEDGRLTAMFIVEYRAGRQTVSVFRRLMRAGVTMLVRTSDPNISASMIADRFGARQIRHLRMLGGDEAAARMAAAAADRAPVTLFFDGGLRSYADTLLACFRLRGTISAPAIVQTAGAVLGMALAAWLSLHDGISVITPVKLLEYQGVWAVPALLIALLRRS